MRDDSEERLVIQKHGDGTAHVDCPDRGRTDVRVCYGCPHCLGVGINAKTLDSFVACKPIGADSIEALIRHVEQNHHAFTRNTLDELGRLAHRARLETSTLGPAAERVSEIIEELDDDLRAHLAKEERILFPYLVAIECAARVGRPKPQLPFLKVKNPIATMHAEHVRANDLLAAAREVVKLHANSDRTMRALDDALLALERDLREHVRVEEEILFPRGVALEEAPLNA